jgi:hypothetical protein
VIADVESTAPRVRRRARSGEPQLQPGGGAVGDIGGNGKAPAGMRCRGLARFLFRWPAGCPAGWQFVDRLLVPGPRSKFRFPGSSCVPGVAPGLVPVSGSDVFLLPCTGAAQGFPAVISRLFSRPQRIHNHSLVVPRELRLFHQPVHNFPTAEDAQ